MNSLHHHIPVFIPVSVCTRTRETVSITLLIGN